MSKLPLWKVMYFAYDTSPVAPMDADGDWTDRHGYAAEIRALRDWLVPEEAEPSDELSSWDRLWERQRIRALLTTEADRAEKGDV